MFFETVVKKTKEYPSKHSSWWRRLEDALIKTNMFALRLQKTSSRHLGQDQYIRLGHTSLRRLQDVFKTFWRPLRDVFKTSSRRLAKACSRHLQGVFKTFWRPLQDVLQKRVQDIFKTSSRHFEDLFKTSWRLLQDVLQRCLQDVDRLNYLPRSHFW